ncbi:MAG: hypothetical protein U0269_20780 [Polyangiales bacterium]
MTAPVSLDVWKVAPRASRGAPADVLRALDVIGAALLRGECVSASELRWPEPLLRAAVLDTIASSELRSATCMRPSAVAVALDDIVTVLEHAWATERKMRAGRALARERAGWLDSGPNDEAIRGLWEPLADRGVRAELRARWASTTVVQARERTMSGPPEIDWAPSTRAAATLGEAATAIEPSLETSADGAVFDLRISLQSAQDSSSRPAVARPAVDPDALMSRGQAIDWLRWRRAAVREKQRAVERRGALEVRRSGAVFITVTSTSQGDELVALALVLLAAASATHRHRPAYLIVADRPTIEQIELVPAMTVRELLVRLRPTATHRPLAALSWLLSRASPEALSEAEFVLVSPSAATPSAEPLNDALDAQIAAARQWQFRMHLLRTKSMAAHSHVHLFDMLHFPEFAPRFFEALEQSCLRSR